MISIYYTHYYTESMKTYPMCVFSSDETEIIKNCISIVSQFFCRSRLIKTAWLIIIFDRHFSRQIFSSELTVFLNLKFGKVFFFHTRCTKKCLLRHVFNGIIYQYCILDLPYFQSMNKRLTYNLDSRVFRCNSKKYG